MTNPLIFFIRIAIVVYIMAGPFIFIWLQQKVFRTSFDDELGNKIILRLYTISTVGLVSLFFLTFEWGRVLIELGK